MQETPFVIFRVLEVQGGPVQLDRLVRAVPANDRRRRSAGNRHRGRPFEVRALERNRVPVQAGQCERRAQVLLAAPAEVNDN